MFETLSGADIEDIWVIKALKSEFIERIFEMEESFDFLLPSDEEVYEDRDCNVSTKADGDTKLTSLNKVASDIKQLASTKKCKQFRFPRVGTMDSSGCTTQSATPPPPPPLEPCNNDDVVVLPTVGFDSF
jgi:hypothetical protein